jgi:hypothetical protein
VAANSKISALTEVVTPLASDVLPVVSGGNTKKVQVGNLPVSQSQVSSLIADLAARVLSSDVRLSDARTPTAHAASHKHGGSDEVAVASSAANGVPKASAGGVLASGWLTKLLTSTDVGTQNDWAPGLDGNTVVEWLGAADLTVTGIAGGVSGQTLLFKNTGTKVAYFKHANAGSAAGNRLTNIATSGDTPVAPGGSIAYLSDGTNWKLIGHNQGEWVDVAYNATDFTASTGTWTVDAGDLLTFAYRLDGRMLTVIMTAALTSVSATPDRLIFKVPGTFTIQRVNRGGFTLSDNGAPTIGTFSMAVSGTQVLLFHDANGATNYAPATNNTYIYFSGVIAIN